MAASLSLVTLPGVWLSARGHGEAMMTSQGRVVPFGRGSVRGSNEHEQ